MADKKEKGRELSLAFESNNLAKLEDLTKSLSAKARGSVRSITAVYQTHRARGMTPLISAILHRNDTVAEMLIREAVDMGQRLEKGVRIVDKEVMESMYVKANMQVISGPTICILEDYSQMTPMFWALKHGNLYLVEKILTCPSFDKDSLVEKLNGMSAVMMAVLENDIPAVQILLRHKVNLHSTALNGDCALDGAIKAQFVDMTRFLLTNGESANCLRHALPPLINAIETGSLDVMGVLIEKGANIQMASNGHMTFRPLHYAIDTSKLKAAKFLIKKGADVNARDRNETTALQVLANLKEEPNEDTSSTAIVEMAKILVSKKADVNALDSSQESALYYAVNSMNVKLVKYLLSIKAQVNSKNKCSQTPLHAAIIPAHATKGVLTTTPETVITRHIGGGLTVNTPYVIPNQREVVRLLLNAGAKVESKDRNLHTPLFLAVGNNNLEMVELLVQAGAKVNGSNIDGLALVHFAVRENNFNILKCLVEVGKANINVTNRVGDTPLHFAVSGRVTAIVELLISAKADVNVKNFIGMTPFSIAVVNQSFKFIKLLVKAGADPNQNSSYLHMAVRDNCQKLAKTLLEAGVKVNMTDKKGMIPLELGIGNSEVKGELIQLLLDYGADPSFCCQKGYTLYQYVISRHEVDLLKMFWQHGCLTDETQLNQLLPCGTKKGDIKASNIPITEEEILLRAAQTNFTEGILKNNPEQVVNAIGKGAVARGVSQALRYPLHYVAKHGYLEVAQVLLTNGVPADSLDDDLNTPLETAVERNDLFMCLTLLSHGACFSFGFKKFCSLYSSRASQITEQTDDYFNTNNKYNFPIELLKSLLVRLDKLEEKVKELNKKMNMQGKRHLSTIGQQRLMQVELLPDPKNMLEVMSKKDGPLLSLMLNQFYILSILAKTFYFIQHIVWLVRRKNSKVILLLDEWFEDMDTPFCKSLMNCVDVRGRTLMCSAMDAGCVRLTEHLMRVRLNHDKLN